MGRRRSQRPAGVGGVVGDSEAVGSLGPELEREAPAGLRVDFHQEAVLGTATERDEPIREHRREGPVREVRTLVVPRGHYRVVAQDLQEGRSRVSYPGRRVPTWVYEGRVARRVSV